MVKGKNMNEQIVTNKDTLNELEKMWNDTLCPHHCNKQCEKFPLGSIVYWIERTNNHYKVNFGTVVEHFSGEVTCQLYEPFDDRLINGIPVKDFQTPTKWQKLPKGWSYDTRLFEIETKEMPKEWLKYHGLNIKNKEDILNAIEIGFLVKVQENDHATFYDEIDTHQGWRIVRRYNDHYLPYKTIKFHQVYSTFEEAQRVIDDIKNELQRQSKLSDKEWSIEQIDKTLNTWSYVYNKTDEEKEKYRNWILELNNVEDVEIKMFGGALQWKYAKNKRWSTIDLSV